MKVVGRVVLFLSVEGENPSWYALYHQVSTLMHKGKQFMYRPYVCKCDICRVESPIKSTLRVHANKFGVYISHTQNK